MKIEIEYPPFVEVYFWLGRDDKGKPATAFDGGKLTQKSKIDTVARCGHVAMLIFPKEKPCEYISLWPGENHPAVLSTFEADLENEGTLPDVIIRLHGLDIEAMLRKFNEIKPRIESGDIQWTFEVSSSKDVTKVKNKKANCASFVLTLLKVGGFANKTHLYNKWTRKKGPTDKNFYKLTRCNVADSWFGLFNWAPWTSWYLTPKGVLLRTASAAEAFGRDKEETEKIMKSNRVSKL